MTATGTARERESPGALVPEAVCRAHLEKVTGSVSFARAAQLRQLLHWLAERALERGLAAPSEKEIGQAVLKRVDFDPQTDSIVRKEAGRLRERLSKYYALEGSRDEVRIRMDEGYVPLFERRARAEGERPCWLVLPFRTGAETSEDGLWLLEELIMGLGKNGGWDVVAPTTALSYRGKTGDIRQFAAECRADFVLEGSLRRLNHALEGRAWMVDGQSGRTRRFHQATGSDVNSLARQIAEWVLVGEPDPRDASGVH